MVWSINQIIYFCLAGQRYVISPIPGPIRIAITVARGYCRIGVVARRGGVCAADLQARTSGIRVVCPRGIYAIYDSIDSCLIPAHRIDADVPNCGEMSDGARGDASTSIEEDINRQWIEIRESPDDEGAVLESEHGFSGSRQRR